MATRHLLAGAALILGLAGLACGGTAKIDRQHLPPPLARCGVVGQLCCQPSQSYLRGQGLYRCDKGLGCNVESGKCETACGGPGQPCCDGPETNAPRWTAGGQVSSPTGPLLKSMCESGRTCSPQSLKCSTSQCGMQPGDACCLPDVRQATASCTGSRLYCQYTDTSSTAGTCAACGNAGQQPCEKVPQCTGTLVVGPNGMCTPCGQPGVTACSDPNSLGYPCAVFQGKNYAPDPVTSACVPAGSIGEVCWRFAPCNGSNCWQSGQCEKGLCNPQGYCRGGCGDLGQACCKFGFQCAEGQCEGDRVCHYVSPPPSPQSPGQQTPSPTRPRPRRPTSPGCCLTGTAPGVLTEECPCTH
jgi:hypothetical protein